jgi:hypothetical protein
MTAYAENVRYVVIRSLPSSGYSETRISQVAVMAGGVNVALNKRCTRNDDFLTDSCNFIIDGTFDAWHSYTSSSLYIDSVTINLLGDYNVTSVIFYNGGVCL